MIGTALISTLMDNLPLTAVMLPIAYSVLTSTRRLQLKSRLPSA